MRVFKGSFASAAGKLSQQRCRSSAWLVACNERLNGHLHRFRVHDGAERSRSCLTCQQFGTSYCCAYQVRFLARSFGVPGDHAGQTSNGYRWPFGPVGLITPFNFPLEIPALQVQIRSLVVRVLRPLAQFSSIHLLMRRMAIGLEIGTARAPGKCFVVVDLGRADPLLLMSMQLMGALYMGNKPLLHVDRRCTHV